MQHPTLRIHMKALKKFLAAIETLEHSKRMELIDIMHEYLTEIYQSQKFDLESAIVSHSDAYRREEEVKMSLADIVGMRCYIDCVDEMDMNNVIAGFAALGIKVVVNDRMGFLNTFVISVYLTGEPMVLNHLGVDLSHPRYKSSSLILPSCTA